LIGRNIEQINRIKRNKLIKYEYKCTFDSRGDGAEKK
jgi:hypothetical protein